MQRLSAVKNRLRWDDVELFLSLCRSRTVGEAGAFLGIDASTVSRRLVLLEEAVGASLFDRGRDGISATKSAEDLFPVAEEMESVMNRFASAADGLEREVSGTVRITCPPDVAAVVVAPLVKDLRARHPSLRLELEAGEAVLDLSRREADLALRTVRPKSGDLVVTKLASVRWVAAGTKELCRELGVVRRWADVPWIGWGARYAELGASRWLALHVDDAVPVLRSDSLAVQLAVASRGAGIALVPEPSVAHYGLVPLRFSRKLSEDAKAWPADELFLVTHRALRDVPRVRAVWDVLVERAGSPERPRQR